MSSCREKPSSRCRSDAIPPQSRNHLLQVQGGSWYIVDGKAVRMAETTLKKEGRGGLAVSEAEIHHIAGFTGPCGAGRRAGDPDKRPRAGPAEL